LDTCVLSDKLGYNVRVRFLEEQGAKLKSEEKQDAIDYIQLETLTAGVPRLQEVSLVGAAQEEQIF
jgi:hypothetical protein